MDDEGAQKVIAAILRLSNKVDKLDTITVEAATIADQGRLAAMDAADATNPKQTANHLFKATEPLIEKFEKQVDDLTKTTENGLFRATRDAKEAATALGSAESALHLAISQETSRADQDQLRTKIIAAIVVVLFCLISWAVQRNSIKSTADCTAFGGHPHVVESDGGDRQIWCSIGL